MREDIHLTEEETLLLGNQAENRSRIYMLLSTFYTQRPRKEFVEKLKKDEFVKNLKIAILGDEGEMKEGLKNLELFVNSIKDISEMEVAKNLSVDFTRLFGGIKKGYGPPPPYESVWRSEGRIMGEWTEDVLREYYEAGIGIDLSDELPDSIGAEMKFMALLSYHEAEAWRKNDVSNASRFLQMEQQFLNDHLLQWIPEFCIRMEEEAKSSFYKGIAIFTREFIKLVIGSNEPLLLFFKNRGAFGS